jgi:hypothetical protein
MQTNYDSERLFDIARNLTKNQAMNICILYTNKMRRMKNPELELKIQSKTKMVNDMLRNYRIEGKITDQEFIPFVENIVSKVLEWRISEQRSKAIAEGRSHLSRADNPNIKNPYEKLTSPPIVGRSYHLSWAYKGAKFILKEIVNESECMVWTGKTNNKLLKVKTKDLLHLR